MRKRALVVLLILTCLVAVATLIQDVRFDRALAEQHEAARAVDRDLGELFTSLASWRGAEAGYIATGQAPDESMKRASELQAGIEAALTRLQSSTTSAEAGPQYDAAAAALARLAAIDGRVREFVTSDRRFEASDLIFVEATEPAERLSDALAAARGLEASAGAARIAATNRLRFGMNAAAIAFVLIGAAIFHRAGSRTTAVPEPAPVRLADPPRILAPAMPARTMDVNLSDAAELCVDLGRVLDGRDVQALLERVASVLTAKGVILWVADSSGALLRPSLTHGYSDRVLARLGTLQVDGDNPTSLAFRSVRAQVVSGASASAPGAIAVPLVTSSGCVGVLAAEVTDHRPGQDTLAVARMIAAQFSALVAPGDEAVRAAQV
jgi:hypothetical protein